MILICRDRPISLEEECRWISSCKTNWAMATLYQLNVEVLLPGETDINADIDGECYAQNM